MAPPLGNMDLLRRGFLAIASIVAHFRLHVTGRRHVLSLMATLMAIASFGLTPPSGGSGGEPSPGNLELASFGEPGSARATQGQSPAVIYDDDPVRSDGTRSQVRGTLTCAAGEVFRLSVVLAQGDARGLGTERGSCKGEAQDFKVELSTNPGSTFIQGTSEACTTLDTALRGARTIAETVKVCDELAISLSGSEPGNQPPPAPECTITSDDSVINGTPGDDIICVGDGAFHEVFAGDGDDIVRGGAGRDVIDGGPGDDRLTGGFGGDDTIIGGPGQDECTQRAEGDSDCETIHREGALAPGVTLDRVDDDALGGKTDPETGDGELLLPQDMAVEVADIVNSGPTEALPLGFLGRVVSVTDVEGGQLVRTEAVSLPEIIPYGEVDLSFEGETPVSDDEPPPEAGGQARGSSTTGPQASADASASAGGVTRSLGCEASATAEVSIDPLITHSIDAGAAWIPFFDPAAYFNGSVAVGGAAGFSASAGVVCDASTHINGPLLGTQVVQVGPVTVVFTLESGIDLNFEASTRAALNVDGTIKGGVQMLASLVDGNFTHGLFPTREASLEAEVLGEVQARFDAKASISLEAYGATGPAVSFGPFVEATARPLEDPWLTIDGGVRAGIDFVFDIWRVHERYTVAEADLVRFNIERRSGTFPGQPPSPPPLSPGIFTAVPTSGPVGTVAFAQSVTPCPPASPGWRSIIHISTPYIGASTPTALDGHWEVQVPSTFTDYPSPPLGAFQMHARCLLEMGSAPFDRRVTMTYSPITLVLDAPQPQITLSPSTVSVGQQVTITPQRQCYPSPNQRIRIAGPFYGPGRAYSFVPIGDDGMWGPISFTIPPGTQLGVHNVEVTCGAMYPFNPPEPYYRGPGLAYQVYSLVITD